MVLRELMWTASRAPSDTDGCAAVIPYSVIMRTLDLAVL
jgi:hypothetical protein